MTVKKLDVFLSSSIPEFRHERKVLAKKISSKPFFNCRLLEDRGAAPTDVIDASIEAVKKSDIYLAIFGSVYSNTTEREYNQAEKNFIPIFNYEKKASRRQRALSKLLKTKIKPSFKKHSFENNRGLYKMAIENLEEFISDLVKKGLEKYQQDRQKLIKDIQVGNKKITEAVLKKEVDAPAHILDEAYHALEQKEYLTSLIKSSIAFEAWLRLIMQDRGESNASTESLFRLIQRAQKLNILEPHEVNLLTELRIIRNNAIHQGKTPTENDVQFVLKTISRIMNRHHALQQNSINIPISISTEVFDKANFQKSLNRYAKAGKIVKGQILKSEFTAAVNSFPNNKDDWNIDLQQAAKVLLDLALKAIKSSVFITEWLTLLLTVLSKCDDTTHKLYVDSLRSKMGKLYRKSTSNPSLIIAIQEINDFDIEILKIIINDSLDWTVECFNSLFRHVDFFRFKQSQPNSVSLLGDWIFNKLNYADKTGNDTARIRLTQIYDEFKSKT